MAKLIGVLVGLGFLAVTLFSFATGLYTYLTTPHEEDVAHALHQEPRDLQLASDGPFGRFDRQQVQRGFQVFKEVCAACHSLQYVAFRNLEELGYNEAEVKKIAADWAIEVPSINPDTGEATTRPALPSDRFPKPYPNEAAGRAANNNAYPPDLSLMAKARENGSDYIYSLLTGYRDPKTWRSPEGEPLPPEAQPSTGLHFNPYFPNLNLAMPAPLTADGQVTYADGTKASVDQMAKDVSAFLVWTAEPRLESRLRTGWAALIFLTVFTVLAYMAYKNIWADRKAKGGRETTSLTDPDKVGLNA